LFLLLVNLYCIVFLFVIISTIGEQLASLIAKKQRPVVVCDSSAEAADEISDVDVQSDGSAVLNTDDELSNYEDEDEEVEVEEEEEEEE
jgi:hypothetical protein